MAVTVTDGFDTLGQCRKKNFAHADLLRVFLLDLLAENADPARILEFRLPEPKQRYLDELLDKNREGTLSEREQGELLSFEQLEHVVRLLKARMLVKMAR